ncbi:signal recognition particle 19 kDa protein [Aplysia californica]|uniref:Signal recognition particle 19 kDa protein n=1 Tax=Aplysia californica TaxID=6500 RepID=A0ABM0JVK2_APLCA|nr:signal recognition particle 19 kDa protein [Aplysia californica]
MATAAPSSANVPSQPRPWNPDSKFKHIDRERWICVYPAYLNSRKTLKEGRKVPKAKAIDNPVCAEIRDVCAAAGLTLGVENKVYPREKDPRDVKFRGRVRVQLKNEDGTPALSQFPDRTTLLLYLADTIPKLKTRQQSQASSSSQQQQQQQQQQQSSKGGQKKKGRK